MNDGNKSSINVLLCDDDLPDRKLIRAFLENIKEMEFKIHEAGNGSEIRDALYGNQFDLIFMDLQMPGKSGFAWIEDIHKLCDTPVIIVTGRGDEEASVAAMRRGAYDYIPKDRLMTNELHESIIRTLKKSRMEKALNEKAKQSEDAIENAEFLERRIITLKMQVEMGKKEISELERQIEKQKVATKLNGNNDVLERAMRKLRQSFGLLRKSLENTIYAMSKIVELRDPFIAGHQQRVAKLACAIANEMNLPVEHIYGLRMTAIIHDIGKISIPLEILDKPGQLSETEFRLIQTHPQIGYDILKPIEFPWPIAQIVLQHHERMNGSGYPQGLLGEEILLEARILAVADVIEALSSDRVYRPAKDINKALEEITRNRGVLYDSKVVDVCLNLFNEKQFKFELDNDDT